jgi:hypothetical protein
MNEDATIISDPKRTPIIAQRRKGGVSLLAGKNVIMLSADELDRLYEFTEADEIPPVTVTPAKARFSALSAD